MSDQNQDTRKPEEIESDIKERRERLDRTLHELEDKVSPHRLLDTTLEYVRGGGANEFASNLSDTHQAQPRALPADIRRSGLADTVSARWKQSWLPPRC